MIPSPGNAAQIKYQPSINIKDLGDYPFARTRALLAGITPQVPDRHNLTIGQPVVEPPQWIKALIDDQDQWRLYPPMMGTRALQQSICDWLIRRYDLPDCADHFAVEPTCGSREGLFLMGMVSRFLPYGHKRLIGIPNPGYAVYAGSAKIAGAQLLPLDCPGGVFPTPDQLEQSILSQLQMVFVCNPDNPSGRIQSAETLKAWVYAARTYGFVLIVDECYSELYLDTPPKGILEIAREIALVDQLSEERIFDNIVCVNSLSKRSSMAGLRSGMMAGDPELVAMVRSIKSYAGNRMPLALQAASVAIWQDEAHVDLIRQHYQANYHLCHAIFADTEQPSIQAGMFLWLHCPNGEDAARTLWQQCGIQVLPGRYLCAADHEQPGMAYVRIALVETSDTLAGILRQIKNRLYASEQAVDQDQWNKYSQQDAKLSD